MGNIQDGPHFEVPSSELAKWLEDNAADSWWNVDGDPLLTGSIPFPCPTDELASELRKINRSLLVEAPRGDGAAKGQPIEASNIGPLLTRSVSELHASRFAAEWANDKFFFLCWRGSPYEWLLIEDSVTAKQFCEETISKAK